jgi:hypothetical protein
MRANLQSPPDATGLSQTARGAEKVPPHWPAVNRSLNEIRAKKHDQAHIHNAEWMNFDATHPMFLPACFLVFFVGFLGFYTVCITQ